MIVKNKGKYFGNYTLGTEKYLGEDYSKKCFIFPGQGMASFGMFKEQYHNYNIIKDSFKKADILSEKKKIGKVSDYILHPEKIEDNNLRAINNLALFTMQVALHDTLVSQNNIPGILTGHSFGEYAVLVSSGLMLFEDVFDIVYYRDFVSPESNSKGYMIAVNENRLALTSILGESKYFFSNFNSNFQTVISTDVINVENVEEILKNNNVKYKILTNIPQPYHSELLKDTRDKMERYIKGTKLNYYTIKTPFYSSVLKKIIDNNNFCKSDLESILINQILYQVDFISQIESVCSKGFLNYIEINDKKMLLNFVENIVVEKKIKTNIALNILEIKKKKNNVILDSNNNKIFSLVSRVIGEVTGYEIKNISLEDRYQEDLGIDSIKKADILLTILDESKIDPGDDFSTAGITSVKDTVLYLSGSDKKSKKIKKNKDRKIVNFSRYIFELKKQDIDSFYSNTKNRPSVYSLDIDGIFKKKESTLSGVVDFLNMEHKNRPNLVVYIGKNYFEPSELLNFFEFWKKVFTNIHKADINIVMISYGYDNFENNGFSSFLKSVKKEYSNLFFKNIHFSDKLTKTEMLEMGLRELNNKIDIDVVYKNKIRHVYVKRNAGDLTEKIIINNKTVFVVVGGAKGITFSLIKNISKKYKSIFFLLGRSDKNDELVKNNISILKENNKNINYISLDASSRNDLDDLFSNIKKQYGKIDIVINAGGVLDINFIEKKLIERAEDELKNKLLPVMNVMELSEKYNISKIVNFSSIVSKYGSAGQSIYTMINEVVAAITNRSKVASVIHWPAWDNVGMTKNKLVLSNLKNLGVALLDHKKADELFRIDLLSKRYESVYYLDKDDDMGYNYGLINFSFYRTLIGSQSENDRFFSSSLQFNRIFDFKNDKFLQDHKIREQGYIPAALAISMFLCLMRFRREHEMSINNFIVHNPLVIRDKSVDCICGAEDSGPNASYYLKSSVINFSCGSVKKSNKNEELFVMESFKKEVIKDSVYSDYYSKDSLYLGPTFQIADKIFIDINDNTVFKIDNKKLLPVVGIDYYDRITQWVDASFQAISSVGLINNIRYIPVSVGEISINKINLTRYFYVIPINVKISPEKIIGDVLVVNEKNEIIIKLRKVVLRAINKYSENRIKYINL